MRLMTAFLTVLLLTTTAWAADFREATWGMSKEEVRQTETAPLLADLGNALAFETSMEGKVFHVFYKFTKEELTEAGYTATKDFAGHEWVDLYETMIAKLTAKYGDPKTVIRDYKDKKVEADPNLWPISMALGESKFFTQWETERTAILATIGGNKEYQLYIAITYTPTKSPDLLNRPEAKTEDQL